MGGLRAESGSLFPGMPKGVLDSGNVALRWLLPLASWCVAAGHRALATGAPLALRSVPGLPAPAPSPPESGCCPAAPSTVQEARRGNVGLRGTAQQPSDRTSGPRPAGPCRGGSQRTCLPCPAVVGGAVSQSTCPSLPLCLSLQEVPKGPLVFQVGPFPEPWPSCLPRSLIRSHKGQAVWAWPQSPSSSSCCSTVGLWKPPPRPAPWLSQHPSFQHCRGLSRGSCPSPSSSSSPRGRQPHPRRRRRRDSLAGCYFCRRQLAPWLMTACPAREDVASATLGRTDNCSLLLPLRPPAAPALEDCSFGDGLPPLTRLQTSPPSEGHKLLSPSVCPSWLGSQWVWRGPGCCLLALGVGKESFLIGRPTPRLQLQGRLFGKGRSLQPSGCCSSCSELQSLGSPPLPPSLPKGGGPSFSGGFQTEPRRPPDASRAGPGAPFLWGRGQGGGQGGGEGGVGTQDARGLACLAGSAGGRRAQQGWSRGHLSLNGLPWGLPEALGGVTGRDPLSEPPFDSLQP